MAPIRFKLTMELARAFGRFNLDGVAIEVPAAATRAELQLYRDRAYIDLVRLAGSGKLVAPGTPDLTERVLLMHGLGTEDEDGVETAFWDDPRVLTIDAPRTPPSTGSPTRSQAAAGCSPRGGRSLSTGGRPRGNDSPPRQSPAAPLPTIEPTTVGLAPTCGVH